MKFTESNDGKQRASIRLTFRVGSELMATAVYEHSFDMDSANNILRSRTLVEEATRKQLFYHGTSLINERYQIRSDSHHAPDWDDLDHEEAMERIEAGIKRLYGL